MQKVSNQVYKCPIHFIKYVKFNFIVPKTKQVISWPDEDLKVLVDRMEACIPEHDTLAFGTRAEKLEWDSVSTNYIS